MSEDHHPIEREDRLLSRVVGREESLADWASLRDAARVDPATWSRLAEALEADAIVRLCGTEMDTVAARVELPLVGAARGEAAAARSLAVADPRSPWFALAGWIAAAIVASLWLATDVARSPRAETAMPAVGEPTDARVAQFDREQAPQPGFDEPVVVRELPPIFVTAEAAADDRVVVTYVRRVLERARTDGLYEWGRDEAGNAWRTAVRPAALTRPQSF